MYSNAQLFDLAQVQPKFIFKNNMMMTIPDDAEGCVDFDAEGKRLERFWDVAHMNVRDMVEALNMSQTDFANGANIPLRTIQNWCSGERQCPDYIRLLLAEHYKLI